MASIQEVLSQSSILTFDCYGTLIDWRGGIESAFLSILGDAMGDWLPEIFDAYVEIEKEVEAKEFQSYRKVLAEVTGRLGDRFGVSLSAVECNRLAELLTQWEPFSDTCDALARLKNRYCLGILSNIDRDLFSKTAVRLGVDFDFTITAEDVRSYKPSLGHFERLVEEHGPKDRILHVAQSLYHDGEPARKLSLAYMWINRYEETNSSQACPLSELPDLKSLADLADGV